MDANNGAAMMEAIEKLAEINQFYPRSPLSFSMGAATSQPCERLEAVVKRADLAMSEAKRAHYARDMDDLLRQTSAA
jgi:GGDEF domain-containing protein